MTMTKLQHDNFVINASCCCQRYYIKLTSIFYFYLTYEPDMTTFITKLNSKKIKATLIVVAASALFACGQPNPPAKNTAQLQEAPTPTTEPSIAKTTPANHSDLLKNVSATVYKDANCGCCKDWISYAEAQGMQSSTHDVADVGLFKDRYGVPNDMRSCHTAVTNDGFVFEGHVPAKFMAQFLANPPANAIGLAVPNMPVGSPGMEYQNKFDPYQVIQLNKDGSTQVFATIEAPQQQL